MTTATNESLENVFAAIREYKAARQAYWNDVAKGEYDEKKGCYSRPVTPESTEIMRRHLRAYPALRKALEDHGSAHGITGEIAVQYENTIYAISPNYDGMCFLPVKSTP